MSSSPTIKEIHSLVNHRAALISAIHIQVPQLALSAAPTSLADSRAAFFF
jgi:hypothetical protein